MQYRIGWLDSTNAPSHIHLTENEGVSTLCGHSVMDKCYSKIWKLDFNIPRYIKGDSRYCKVCFKNGGKSLPWIKRLKYE